MNGKEKVYRKQLFIISPKKVQDTNMAMTKQIRNYHKKVYIYNLAQCKIGPQNSLAQIMRMFKMQMNECKEERFIQGY